MKTVFIAFYILWISVGLSPSSSEKIISNVMHHKNVWITIDIGECKECGRNLEKFLIKQNGVVTVEFARKSKTLKIVYDPAYITELDIHEKIADLGYDNQFFKSDDDSYFGLPECCRYRDKSEE
jgi:copper chaperone CopZ